MYKYIYRGENGKKVYSHIPLKGLELVMGVKSVDMVNSKQVVKKSKKSKRK